MKRMAVKRRQIAREADTLELLPLALSRPKEALARARAVLAADPEPYDASIAHQAIGIVLRDFGDVGVAVRELRTAVRLAGEAGSPEREADVLATLGLALVFSGRTRSGLAAFERAVRQASGLLAGRVLMRLALALWTLGRHQDALEALRPAVTMLRRADDMIWEARALTARAFVHLALGSVERATIDIARAERLFAAAGQEYESAVARHNRGVIAFRSGDLPAALAFLDEAAGRYHLLSAEVPDLSIDRCAVLLAAGLSRDALEEADRAIRGLEQVRGQATKRAELLLTAANSALAAADTRAAMERAGAARRLFGAQQRPWWRAHAGFLLVRAGFAAGMASGRLLRQAERTAALLDGLRAGDASQAHLLAGRTALALARFQDADRHLAIAARARRRGPVLYRAGGWLAEALRAEAVAGPRQVLNACRRGLDLLDEHRDTLGASELRAQATAHGAELAALAQRQALRAARLVQIVEIDGDLHALVCGGGRVRRFPAGRADEAAREVDFARFGLRRLAYNRPVGRAGTAVALLEATGRRLERVFLGQAGRHLGSGPVVVVPPGRLHAVPWALLPSFRDRVLSVAPLGERLAARAPGHPARAARGRPGARSRPWQRRRRSAGAGRAVRRHDRARPRHRHRAARARRHRRRLARPHRYAREAPRLQPAVHLAPPGRRAAERPRPRAAAAGTAPAGAIELRFRDLGTGRSRRAARPHRQPGAARHGGDRRQRAARQRRRRGAADAGAAPAATSWRQPGGIAARRPPPARRRPARRGDRMVVHRPGSGLTGQPRQADRAAGPSRAAGRRAGGSPQVGAGPDGGCVAPSGPVVGCAWCD